MPHRGRSNDTSRRGLKRSASKDHRHMSIFDVVPSEGDFATTSDPDQLTACTSQDEIKEGFTESPTAQDLLLAKLVKDGVIEEDDRPQFHKVIQDARRSGDAERLLIMHLVKSGKVQVDKAVSYAEELGLSPKPVSAPVQVPHSGVVPRHHSGTVMVPQPKAEVKLVHNFGVYVWHGSRNLGKRIVQFDFQNNILCCIQKGNVTKRHDFTEITNFENGYNLYLSIKFIDGSDLEMDADSIEEKHKILRLLQVVSDKNLHITREDEEEDVLDYSSNLIKYETVLKEGILQKKSKFSRPFGSTFSKKIVQIKRGQLSYSKIGEEPKVVPLTAEKTAITKVGHDTFCVLNNTNTLLFRVPYSGLGSKAGVTEHRDDWVKVLLQACQNGDNENLQRSENKSGTGLVVLVQELLQALNGIERELIHVTSKEKVTSLMRLAQTLEQHVQHLPLGDTMQQPPTADTYTRATVGDILESIQEDPSNNSYDEEYDSVQTEANGNLRPASGDTDAHSFGDNHGRIVNYMTEISSDYSCVDDGEEEDGEQKDGEEAGEERLEGEEQEDGEEEGEEQEDGEEVGEEQEEGEEQEDGKEAGEEQEGNHEEKEEEGDEKKEEDGVEEDSHLEAFSVDPSAKAHVKEEIQYTDEVHQGSNSKELVYSEDSEISVAASMRALSDLLQELDNGEQSAEETMAEGSVQKPDCSNEKCLPSTQSSTLITGSVDSGQSRSDVPPSTPTNSSTAPLPTPSPPTSLPQGTPPPLPPPLCAPPPPPGAPPPPGGQFSMKTGRTLKKTTQQKLRMFRFSTLPVNAVDNSVWKDLRDLTSSIDTKALEDMFALEENKTQRMASTAVQPGLSKQQPKSLLDPKKAQNLGIFLMGLKMSAAQLKQKLDIVDEASGGLTTEQITAIRRYQPDKNEQKTLEQYSGAVSDLDRADQFMLELCRIPHLDLKLELLLAIRELAAQIDDIEPSMELVSMACDELLGSQMFVVILEYILAVGNYINSSGGKGGLMGFHLSSLLKLADYKSKDKSTTLLHYVVTELQAKDSAALEVTEELITVDKCCDLSLQALTAEVDVMEKDLAKIKKLNNVLHQKSKEKGALGENFHKDVEVFAAAHATRLQLLADKGNQVLNKFKTIQTKFGESPNKSSDETFAIVSQFMQSLKKVKLQQQRVAGQNKTPVKSLAAVLQESLQEEPSRDSTRDSQKSMPESKKPDGRGSVGLKRGNSTTSIATTRPTIEGYLEKLSGGTHRHPKWDKRYFEVSITGHLHYSKKPNDKNLGSVYMKGAPIRQNREDPRVIVIETEDRHFKLRTRTEEEAVEWTEVLCYYGTRCMN